MVLTQFVWDSNEVWRSFRISIFGSYLSHPPNDVIKVQQKSFWLLILPLFIPQRTNNKSHLSTTFVTMLCAKDNIPMKILKLGVFWKKVWLIPTQANWSLRAKGRNTYFQRMFYQLAGKETFQVQVHIKFFHICKDRENPFFCSGASSGKTFRQSNSFRDKSDIFWIKALQIFNINSWNPADLDSVTYNGLAGFSGPSSRDIQQITRVNNFETNI